MHATSLAVVRAMLLQIASCMVQDTELGSHPDLESVPEDDLSSMSEASTSAPLEKSAPLRKSLSCERDSEMYHRNLRSMLRKQLPAEGVSTPSLAFRVRLPCSNQLCPPTRPL